MARDGFVGATVSAMIAGLARERALLFRNAWRAREGLRDPFSDIHCRHLCSTARHGASGACRVG